jgi:membrane-bound metal-dependent hydrolase YbcI (DUF457 family)
VPVTPFHFGAGLLAKGIIPRQLSFLAFVVSQVLIDCETGYYLLVKREWPFHRWAHTLLVGSAVGLAAGFTTWIGARLVLRLFAGRWRVPDLREAAIQPAILGGVVGGVSHSLLDAVMHDDVYPLLPFSKANPLLGLISLPLLHLGLIAAGIVGCALLFPSAERPGVLSTRRAKQGAAPTKE